MFVACHFGPLRMESISQVTSSNGWPIVLVCPSTLHHTRFLCWVVDSHTKTPTPSHAITSRQQGRPCRPMTTAKRRTLWCIWMIISTLSSRFRCVGGFLPRQLVLQKRLGPKRCHRAYHWYHPLHRASALSASLDMTENASGSPPVSTIPVSKPTCTNKECSNMAWQEYTTLLQDVMTRDRVVKKTRTHLLPQVQAFLLERPATDNLRKDISTTMDNTSRMDQSVVKKVLREEYQSFVTSKGWGTAQTAYMERCLATLVDATAKQKLARAAQVAWYKMRQISMLPRENTLRTLLFVFGLSEETRSVQTDVATLHCACFQPDETTVSLRIQASISDGDPCTALSLLNNLPSEEWRLRTCQALLQCYCRNKIPQALHLFRQMRNAPGVHLDEMTYVHLWLSLAKQGFFSKSRTISDTDRAMLLEAGYAEPGSDLLNALGTDMADDLLEWNEANACQVYHAMTTSLTNNKETCPPESLPKASSISTGAVLGRVTVDPQSGRCPASQAQLRLISLSPEQRTQVCATLLEMAVAQNEEYAARQTKKKRQRKLDGKYAMDELNKFIQWLGQRNHTAIIDGPNVAYFGHPSLHYSQVALMVEHLEALGERPVVVMPYKYAQSSFYVATIQQEQRLSGRDLEVLDKLKEKDQLYVVPEGCLDDYYWMVASVVGNSTSSNESDLPGLRPLLISNDQMRDHRLTLLEDRLFRRWTSSHLVRYNFGPYQEDEWTEDRNLTLQHADFISQEIQANPTPNGGGLAWHIPIVEWNTDHPNDRFCISIDTEAH